MTKKRSSKRALLMSILSILTCMTMLIGSTFAWFTDSVTSSGNIIKSGTLDVSMEWADGKTDPDSTSTTWTDASTGAIFNNDKWEPGYVEVRHLKIENKGSLALKYQLNIAANGAVSDLADVIDVYYADPAKQVLDRTALIDDDKLGTLTAALAGMSTTASGNLESGESDVITIALKMQESADNTYQDKAIGSDFAIQLFATQLTSELDSFDNQYDQASTFLNQDEEGNWLVASAADMLYLAQQVNGGNSYRGETILLANDVDLKNMKWTPIGNGSNGFMGTFDGQGHSISNYSVTGTTSVGLFGYALNGGNIKNLTVKNATVKANDYAGAILGRGYTDVVNCHVENAVVTVTPYLIEGGVYDGGAKAGAVVGQLLEGAGNSLVNCSAKNVKVAGYRDIGAVLGMAHNNNTVTDCKAYDSEVSYVYLEPGQSYNENKPNENIGEVIGRRNSGVVESGTEFSNVILKTKVFATSNEELQAALDNAEAGTTINLVPNTNYGHIVLSRPTKNNETLYKCTTHNYSTEDAGEYNAHMAEVGYHTTPNYITTLKDLTIIGAEGATIEGLVCSSGHFYGDVYDYVRDIDYDSGSAYYFTLNMSNVTIENVNFTGKIDINTSDADSVYDGITFDGCTFTTNGTASANGAAIRYYNEANNGNVRNIIVKNCKFNNCYQGMYIHNVNGISATDNNFDATGHNAIAIQSGPHGAVNLKKVVIDGNTFSNIADRIIRFGEIGADSNITIQDNTATNSGNANGEVMKAVSIADGITTTIQNNSWGGTVVDEVLKDK